MPRRNATGVVCKFLNWGIDVVCMVLLSGQPLMVTCAGLSMSLVLVVVFLVVGDSSECIHQHILRTGTIELIHAQHSGRRRSAAN
jgi:hypothetical protein